MTATVLRRCIPVLFVFLHLSAYGQNRTELLQKELVAGTPPATQVRQQLRSILAAPEFSEKFRQPSVWDRWQRQFYAWLRKRLARLFDSIAQHPTTSQAIFWTVMLGSFAFIALQLFRLFRRSETAMPLGYKPESAVMHDVDWIAAAKSAAERGDLNKAIQCSYWAAIVCLQSAGTLPRTGAHTPREFLTLLRATSSLSHLRSITSSLERFWYGRMPASTDDFAATLRSVEALGCKLD